MDLTKAASWFARAARATLLGRGRRPVGAYLPDAGLRELLALAHRPSHDRKAS